MALSSKAYISRNTVQSKISNCNLIAFITEYMRSELSNIISELQKDNALAGQVLLVAYRGQSAIGCSCKKTTMIYTHVLSQGGEGVHSPLDL